MNAIAASLKQDKMALLARFLPRVNGDISIGYLTPLPGETAYARTCLIMNTLPFEADVRTASFTAFSQNPKLLPHKEQTAAVDELITAFNLGEGSCIVCCCCTKLGHCRDPHAQESKALSLHLARVVCVIYLSKETARREEED